MTRFWRFFMVSTALFALASAYYLLEFGVRWPPALLLASLLPGAILGGIIGAIARSLPPGRPTLRRFASTALAMSIVGLVGAPTVPLLPMVIFQTPLPQGIWRPLAHQPPKKAVAFLGERWVVESGYRTVPKLYVVTADGTVYSSRLGDPERVNEWSEERAADSPTTLSSAGSFGIQTPPLFRKTLSRQRIDLQGIDSGWHFYFALSEQGTIWRCYWGYSALDFQERAFQVAIGSALIGPLTGLVLLFGSKERGQGSSDATPATS